MAREPLQPSRSSHDLAQECKYDSLTMFRASCAHVFFCLLNIVLLFYLLKDLNIAGRVISWSYGTRSTSSRDAYNKQTYIQEKPWNQVWESPEPTWSISCDVDHYEYDLCYLNRPTVIDPTTATVYATDPTNSTPPMVIKTRPYPRKGQPDAMEHTKELTLTTSPLNTSCAVTHDSPALIFSAGGFAGNVFHDFNDGWVPLFLTVEEHFVDRDIILAIVDCHDWWLVRYAELFAYFTRHPIVNLDKETVTHCFPSAIVGLKTHGVMIVDPTLQRGPRPKTMSDFRALLANAYDPSLTLPSQVLPTFSSDTRPKLAFLNRMNARKVLNEPEVRRVAEEVGFDVVVFEVTAETPMRDIFRLLESSHAFAGVHGAGLTHSLFLRPGSVFVQIVPHNTGWVADLCFGKLAIRLGLEYIVYEVGIHENTLEMDDFVVRVSMDPESHHPASSLMGILTDWNRYMSQPVKIDVVQFKRYLKRAYDKAKVFAEKERSYSQH